MGGLFLLENIKVTTKPGTTHKIVISTDGIDLNKADNQQYYAANNIDSSSLPISVGVRECIQGESYLITGECSRCEGPT